MLEIPSSSYVFKNLFTHNFCLPVPASRTVREDTEEELLKISAGISKKLAVLGLTGILLTSLGTGIAMNACINKVEDFQEQKNERRKKATEYKRRDMENRNQNIKNKQDQEKKTKDENSIIFKSSAK